MFKGVLLFTILVFSSFSAQAQMAFPTGVFSSHVGRDVGKYIHEGHVKGALVRVRWSEIEAKEGGYDFSAIEKQRKPVVDAGKQWSLAVIAGANVPNWMYSKTTERMDIYFRQDAISIIPFWNSVYQDSVSKLAKALADKYGKDQSLMLVYIPQQTSNGIEGHFNGNAEFVLRRQGLTESRWVSAAKYSVDAFAKAFPNKALAMELHEMLGGVEIPAAIMEYMYRHHGSHVGIGVWWLSGKEKYQSSLLELLKESSLPVYAQVIGRSSQKRRFHNYNYATVFKQAEEIGAHYVEVWNYEFEKPVEKSVTDAIKKFAYLNN